MRTSGAQTILIIVVAFVVLRFGRLAIHGVVQALLDREATEGTAQELSAIEVRKRIDTLDGLGGNVLRFFVVVIAGIMILGRFGLDFGAQSLVRDYLTGALILVENQFSKGDIVSVAGVTGTVEDFSLRRTTLRDLDGVVHTVPNGEIKVASNRTRTWARINQDVMVAFGTDIDRAIDVVDGVGREMAADPIWKRRILEAPRVERVESIAEMGITLKILGSVRAGEQWAASGEFRKLLLAAFTDNGIEIPRPHRVVFTGEGGTAILSPDGPTQDELAGD